MKKTLLIYLCLFICLFIGLFGIARADNPTSQPVILLDTTVTSNITSQSGSSSIAVINTNGKSTVNIAIPTGTTFNATLVPVVSVDGINYVTAYAVVQGSSTTVSSISAPGTWSLPAAGYASVGLQATSYTSGTIPVSLRAGFGANIYNCVYNCNVTSTQTAPRVKLSIALGFASGTVSTSTIYPTQIMPAYTNGVISVLRAAGTTNDNGTTVFTVYKNGTSIGTLSFSNGVNSATTTLGTPVSINVGDILKLSCTTAGTITNVGIIAEGNADTF